MNDATKHSGPVDVLAVLSEIESFMAISYPNYDSAEKLRATRAAVADLIEAGGRLQFTKRDGKFLPVDTAAIADFVVAFANIRSAS